MDNENTDVPQLEPQSEAQPARLDDVRVTSELQLVGIGASAGGLPALQRFFQHTPPDSGLAFVVILHLSATHESSAAEVLQHTTAMPVHQVTEAVAVAPNHVYVIPPAQDLSMLDGEIQLQARESPGERRAPIDLFFRTLADSYGSAAAAVVLSGSGADGANGVARIKEAGGVTLAQDPDEAEFAEMPRNAIATGMVDYVLPAAALPQALLDYGRNAASVQLPASAAQQPSEPATPAAPAPHDTDALREIFALLRVRTNHDFSQYKRPTVLRRIARRMQVHGTPDLPAYLQILRAQPDELQALKRDLLISVTNFFRDAEVWLTIESLIPELFAGKQAGEQVRVWVAGCATGEEAYSVAMLLHEYAATLPHPPAIQIFATDTDEDAIAVARQGLYRDTIAADVSAERLARFFVVEQGRYRISREIRDLVLFAVHNVLRDPPFSHLDLVTCRNLLIYFNRTMQEQVLNLFHFTLLPGGYLLLGTSESTDVVPNLFTAIDKSQRLFQRSMTSPRMSVNMPRMTLTNPSYQRLIAGSAGDTGSTQRLAEVHQQLLTQYSPPSVLINPDYDIVRLSRRGGRYLELAEGEIVANLLKLIHPSLRIELRAALFQATQQGDPVETRRVHLDIQGEPRLVSMLVQPLREPDWLRGYTLIIFNESADLSGTEHGQIADAEPLVRQLEDELQRTKDQLRTMIEQYETTNEEYKAANEELQAINEELRATTEELETSKEELQAINEELTTVNQEMKFKVEELSLANSDLQNLLASTQIATIFIDRELRIRRYTASAQSIFNLIPSDVGRPLAHITHKLEYDQLTADATQVLETLAKVEREVQSNDGQTYLMRMVPYRTLEDKIDGVTLFFVGMSERR
jgi:two-component system CheB/CheR fusion protein